MYLRSLLLGSKFETHLTARPFSRSAKHQMPTPSRSSPDPNLFLLFVCEGGSGRVSSGEQVSHTKILVDVGIRLRVLRFSAREA